MSPKSFSILLLATAVSVGLAGWAVAERDVPAASRTLDEPLFPGLAERLADVSIVQVTTDGSTFTLRRDGDAWHLAERGGYPADRAKLREVARAVAALRLVEAKTSSGDRLSRLDLDDPAVKGSKAKLVTLEAGDGKPIASVVLGKPKYSLYGGGRGGTYVRRNGEDQAWLAAGEVSVPGDALGWLDEEVVSLPEAEIRRVTLGEGGADPTVITRPDPASETLVLDRLPEGRTADQEVLSRVAAVLDKLSMSDVRKADARPMPADAPKARFETQDGLVLTVTSTIETNGDKQESWVALDVGADPSAVAGSATAAAPQTDAVAVEAKPADAQHALADRVAELKGKLAGWQFQLPAYIAERLTYDREKLLAKPPGMS